MAERLYTTYQIADLLDATPSTVVDWMQKGWLPFQRLPDGPVRISEHHLVAFLKNQGIEVNKIIDEFPKEQIEMIYPALSPQLMGPLIEELELMSYLDIKDGKTTVTKKGEAKLKDFIGSLSVDEKEALKL